MAAKKTTNTKNTLPILTQGLLEAFEPLVTALDSRLADAPGLEDGKEYPSATDNQMRFLIGGIIQNLHRQNFGVITDKKGNTYDNSKERLQKSEKQWAEALDEMKRTGQWSNGALNARYWFHVNEARYNLNNELIAAFATVYRQIFNEDWKPATADAPKPTTKAITPEELARLTAELDNAVKRSPSRLAEIKTLDA